MNTKSKHQQRIDVVNLRAQNYTFKEIQAMTGHHKNYVKRRTERWQKTSLVEDLPHPGAKSKFCSAFQKKVVQILKTSKRTSVRKVARQLNTMGNSISKSSIHRIAHRNNLKVVTPIKKPFLSKVHKQQRIEFANRHTEPTK